MEIRKLRMTYFKKLKKFELISYLEGRLEGLRVTTFEKLKNQMVAHQVKRRASIDIKKSLIDSWSNFIDPDMLAAKLNEYYVVRKPVKKLPVSLLRIKG